MYGLNLSLLNVYMSILVFDIDINILQFQMFIIIKSFIYNSIILYINSQ